MTKQNEYKRGPPNSLPNNTMAYNFIWKFTNKDKL